MKRVLGLSVALAGALSCTLSAPGWATSMDSPLLEAVRADDLDTIKALLDKHADPNAILPDKSTVLAWAVDRQNPQSVHMLLAAGAKPNVADVSGATPLTLACELGNAAIVDDLIGAGADVKAARPDGVTALSMCAGTTAPEAVEKLAAGGADVNRADPHGQTALMWAAAGGRTDNIAVLLKHGANVNAVADKGFTPLFFALKSKVPQASDALVAAGADTKARLPDGTSIIEASLVENNIPFAMEMVRDGADVHQRDTHGRELIHVAAASGNAELVRLVLSKGADPNVMSVPPAPEAEEAPAGQEGAKADAQKLAVADGSRAARKPKEYATPPLILAAQAGSLEAMKALVQAGAKPGLKAADGTTLALAAAYGGSLEAMQYAYELDPHLDAKTEGGKSIMHLAVENWSNLQDREKMISFLADKGAILNAPDARKQTPADNLNRGQAPQELRVFYVQLLKDRKVEASKNH